MGAQNFEESITTDKNFRDAFDEARQESSWSNGHGGYSGSLAEKNEVVLISSDVRSSDEAFQYANKLIKESDPRINDKWGPAGAIGFYVSERPKEISKRTKQITVTVNGDVDGTFDTAVRDEAEKVITLKDGESITNLVLFGMYGSDKCDPALPAPKQTFVISTSVPQEKTETRFLVSYTAHDKWKNGFKTQAEARKFAVDTAKDTKGDKVYRNAGFPITSETRLTSGDPILTVTRELVKTVFRVEVEITKKTKTVKGTKNTSWLFFGWASS